MTAPTPAVPDLLTRHRPTSSPAPRDDTGVREERQPVTAHEAMRELADWLDEADRLIDAVFASRHQARPNSGDDVQRDLRALADWFEANPDAATAAWTHVARAAALDSTEGRR